MVNYNVTLSKVSLSQSYQYKIKHSLEQVLMNNIKCTAFKREKELMTSAFKEITPHKVVYKHKLSNNKMEFLKYHYLHA